MYLLLKFDVRSPSITGDRNILKLIALLAFSRSKIIDSLLTLDRSGNIVILLSLKIILLSLK